MQSPHATANVSQPQHTNLDKSSAGCLADSTQGKKALNCAAKQIAAFFLNNRFKGKEGLRPLVIEQAVGMLSCKEKITLSCRAGQEPTRCNSLRTVLDSPKVIWSPKRHRPRSTADHRFCSNKVSGNREKGTVGFNSRCGQRAPPNPFALAILFPKASPCLRRELISNSFISVIAMPNPPQSCSFIPIASVANNQGWIWAPTCTDIRHVTCAIARTSRRAVGHQFTVSPSCLSIKRKTAWGMLRSSLRSKLPKSTCRAKNATHLWTLGCCRRHRAKPRAAKPSFWEANETLLVLGISHSQRPYQAHLL